MWYSGGMSKSMTPSALILCETSGVVREAMRAQGIDAVSCDVLPAEDGSPNHLQMDMRQAVGLHRGGKPWAFIGAHLACTFVCVSGIHWNNRGRGWDKTEAAIEDVRWFMGLDAPGYLENPVGIISTRVRKPDQILQPYEFGHDASKATCLWLKHLPKLKSDPRKMVAPRLVCQCGATRAFAVPDCPSCGETNACAKPRWANQTNSGQNRLAPSDTRWKDRSRTYPGIAKAMAEQWAIHILKS